MARKKWDIKPVDLNLAKELAEECDISQMVALILSGRGYSDPFDIDEFLNNDQQLADPFELPDMEKAVERILQAIENDEIIAVCGDYDADGVTASSLLYLYLKNKGCNVLCDIPQRLDDGYGLHKNTILKLKQNDVRLIITVDNGISAVDEIDYAASLDIDVVVTDHHQPSKVLPNAVALVDPHFGMPADCFADYAGVGVAFKLICALEGCSCEEMMEQYGDLVAIGTIADMVPLVGENRVMVIQGLERINNLSRIGVKELIIAAEVMVENITAHEVAFGLAPKLNAAGRMGDSFRAFRLLTTNDINEARLLASEICQENSLRQEVELSVWEACLQEHMENKERFYNRVIVVAGYEWHNGVLGIVASRLCQKFGKPAIVLSVDGEVAKGSARSVEGFDIFEALTACSDCLTQVGGHPLAAGLTLPADKIIEFRDRINEYAKQKGDRPIPRLDIDCKLTPAGVNDATAFDLQPIAPFGCDNPVPLFGLLKMELKAVNPVGGGKSLRLTLCRDGITVSCMKFGMTLKEFPFQVGDLMDLAFIFRYSTYKNRPGFSLTIQDFRPYKNDDAAMFRDMILFEKFLVGEQLLKEEKALLLPSREELGLLYRHIKGFRNFNKITTLEEIHLRLQGKISFGKILIGLEVFEEFEFIAKVYDGYLLDITYLDSYQKHDLSTSSILKKLQS